MRADITKYQTIRFRRWSRAGFAVFVSIHKQVSIGVLTNNVSGKSVRKNKFRIDLIQESITSEEHTDCDLNTEIELLNENKIAIIASNTESLFAALQNAVPYIFLLTDGCMLTSDYNRLLFLQI